MNPFPVTRVGRLEPDHDRPGWLVESLWAEQATGFIGGTPKSCKTWLALELAVAVASGRPCLGRYRVPERGHVLMYAAEDAAASVRHRTAGIARARSVDLDNLAVGLITEPSIRLDQPGDQERLGDTLAKIRPKLLVLDPLVRLHRGDENSAGEVSVLLAFLRQLQRENAVAIAVVHHVRKASASQPGQALRGSGDLHAWSDSNLYLLRRKDELVLHAEHRAHPAPDAVVVELCRDPLHLRVLEKASDEPRVDEELCQRALAELQRRGPTTRTALREHLAIRNQTLGHVLAVLEGRGSLYRGEDHLIVPRSGP